MHDLKFATDILNALKKSGVKPSAKTIVTVQLSPFTHVTPEGLQATATHILSHEGYEKVKLDIKPLPYQLICKGCKKVSEHLKPVFACPDCGSGEFDIKKEREFFIESIG